MYGYSCVNNSTCRFCLTRNRERECKAPPPNAALIGAFTSRIHLNARRGRGARTFVATLSRAGSLSLSPVVLFAVTSSSFSSSSRPDEEGDARATRRASATRSHEPSRGTKLVLSAVSLSLFRPTSRSHENRSQENHSSFLSSSTSTSTFAATSGSTRFLLFPPPRRGDSFLSLARSHERSSPETDVRSLAYSKRSSVLTRAHGARTHEGTSRPRVPTCAK